MCRIPVHSKAGTMYIPEWLTAIDAFISACTRYSSRWLAYHTRHAACATACLLTHRHVCLLLATCRNGRFLFDFVISTGYPYDAPKVKCKTKVSPLGSQQRFQLHVARTLCMSLQISAALSYPNKPESPLGLYQCVLWYEFSHIMRLIVGAACTAHLCCLYAALPAASGCRACWKQPLHSCSHTTSHAWAGCDLCQAC